MADCEIPSLFFCFFKFRQFSFSSICIYISLDLDVNIYMVEIIAARSTLHIIHSIRS